MPDKLQRRVLNRLPWATPSSDALVTTWLEQQPPAPIAHKHHHQQSHFSKQLQEQWKEPQHASLGPGSGAAKPPGGHPLAPPQPASHPAPPLDTQASAHHRLSQAGAAAEQVAAAHSSSRTAHVEVVSGEVDDLPPAPRSDDASSSSSAGAASKPAAAAVGRQLPLTPGRAPSLAGCTGGPTRGAAAPAAQRYQVLLSPAATREASPECHPAGDEALVSATSWEDMAAALDESAANLARATSASSHLMQPPAAEQCQWEGTSSGPSPHKPPPGAGQHPEHHHHHHQQQQQQVAGAVQVPPSATAAGAGRGGGGGGGDGHAASGVAAEGSGWEGDGVMWWDEAPTPGGRRPGLKAQMQALLSKWRLKAGSRLLGKGRRPSPPSSSTLSSSQPTPLTPAALKGLSSAAPGTKAPHFSCASVPESDVLVSPVVSWLNSAERDSPSPQPPLESGVSGPAGVSCSRQVSAPLTSSAPSVSTTRSGGPCASPHSSTCFHTAANHLPITQCEVVLASQEAPLLPQLLSKKQQQEQQQQQQLVVVQCRGLGACGSSSRGQPGHPGCTSSRPSSSDRSSLDCEMVKAEYGHWSDVVDRMVDRLQQEAVAVGEQLEWVGQRTGVVEGLLAAVPPPTGYGSSSSVVTMGSVRVALQGEHQQLVDAGQTLSDRAALLGSAMGRLQGCRLALGRAALALALPDRVAVLQLVLGDVAETLAVTPGATGVAPPAVSPGDTPGVSLEGELGVLLAGLPPLGEAGRRLVALAGSSPVPVSPQAPATSAAAAPVAGGGGGGGAPGGRGGTAVTAQALAGRLVSGSRAQAALQGREWAPEQPQGDNQGAAAAAAAARHESESEAASDPMFSTLSEIFGATTWRTPATSLAFPAWGSAGGALPGVQRALPQSNTVNAGHQRGSSFDLQGFETVLGQPALAGPLPAAAPPPHVQPPPLPLPLQRRTALELERASWYSATSTSTSSATRQSPNQQGQGKGQKVQRRQVQAARQHAAQLAGQRATSVPLPSWPEGATWVEAGTPGCVLVPPGAPGRLGRSASSPPPPMSAAAVLGAPVSSLLAQPGWEGLTVRQLLLQLTATLDNPGVTLPQPAAHQHQQ